MSSQQDLLVALEQVPLDVEQAKLLRVGVASLSDEAASRLSLELRETLGTLSTKIGTPAEVVSVTGTTSAASKERPSVVLRPEIVGIFELARESQRTERVRMWTDVLIHVAALGSVAIASELIPAGALATGMVASFAIVGRVILEWFGTSRSRSRETIETLLVDAFKSRSSDVPKVARTRTAGSDDLERAESRL